MSYLSHRVLGLGASGAILVCALLLAGKEPPRTGPETEKRFPPLKVPSGFKATLFACDPLIEYPSVIALGPRAHTVFVAVDYMTGLGTTIVRRDEVRLVEDSDGDGYADKATVFADKFNSIQGLAYYGGTVYVMHAPFLTALRDKDGDGKADERKDLFTGLGLPPEKNPPRLHCANGVVAGHDGWLYLALGDHGCDVPRPEGDRLVFEGGGILRCRPDGRDLHVFATGLRNIYDVALDADLNVFVRDNENDGGDYKIRVCHSFFGADHGYPYLYYERPDEALPPLADLGLGSSAGGLCYLERQFPAAYRGNLFFCEWGRAVMRYPLERAGGGFAPVKEIEFAAGAPKDPYGFKPTDLIVDRDGSLIVADWGDGQQPKRGRGRIYRISYVGKETARAAKPGPRKNGLEQWLAQLDSESYHERTEAQTKIEQRGQEGLKAVAAALAKAQLGTRGRLHAIWIIAHGGGQAVTDDLFNLARTDPDPRVKAQSVRALADLSDPVLTHKRLSAGAGDPEVARRLAALASGQDPRVLLEVIIALGRLRWSDAPAWLEQTLTKPNPALAQAAMQTLRRSENWPALLKLLDSKPRGESSSLGGNRPSTEPIRAIALRAIADQAVPALVDGLIDRLRTEPDAGRRRQYADALTRVYKKPGPWVYWGYRPPPRPPNKSAWERTDAIEQALNRVLTDPDRAVRLAVLRRMQREKIPTRLANLGTWLGEENEAQSLGAILEALREHPAGATRTLLEATVADDKKPVVSRLVALAMFASGLNEASEARLVVLARSLEDDPVLAEALRQIGTRPRLKAAELVVSKLDSPVAGVRAAAVEAAGALRIAEAAEPLLKLLEDKDGGVRNAAATAAGKLGVKAAGAALLRLATDPEPGVRRTSLESLTLLKEPRAVPLAALALNDPDTQQPALRCIAEVGGPEQASGIVALARQNQSTDVLPLVLRTLTKWSQQAPSKRRELGHAVADLQGASGVLARWQVTGPVAMNKAPPLVERLGSAPNEAKEPEGNAASWRIVFGTGTESRLRLDPAAKTGGDGVWLAYTDLHLPERTAVQFLAASSAPLRVWLNGQLAYQRESPRRFESDGERFDATLEKGANRVLVQLSDRPPSEAKESAVEFQVRFRRKSSTAEHEKLVQAALTQAGKPERGRKLFLNAERSQCVKCHRLGDQGERIGPELTGIGNRFSRIHLIESILEPNRAITPGYQGFVVTLNDGRAFTGVKVAETADTLTLGDNQGKKHLLKKSDIDEQRPHPLSTMPEGLERPLSADEFIDLIAFLVSQKDGRPQ